jgi:hypothetical protein
MEECLVPAHRNQHFQWLGTTTGMPKMRKVQLRTPIHVIIVPTTLALYADELPNSVPQKLREACLARLEGETRLSELAKREDLNLVYPLLEMKAGRHDEAFYPVGNFHADGLSLKVLRDAFIKKAGLNAKIDESIERTALPSEILKSFGIMKPFPIYKITNRQKLEIDEPAITALSSKVSKYFPNGLNSQIFMNPADDVSGTVLFLTDSFGVRAAPVFAAGFKRVIQIYTNPMQQDLIHELIATVAKSEHIDRIVMLLYDGGMGRINIWAQSMKTGYSEHDIKLVTIKNPDLGDYIENVTSRPHMNVLVDIGGTKLDSVWTNPPVEVIYRNINVGPRSRLALNIALHPEVHRYPAASAEFKIRVIRDGKEGEGEIVHQTLIDAFNHQDQRGWTPVLMDLSAYEGQTISIALSCSPGPTGETFANWCIWGDPVVENAGPKVEKTSTLYKSSSWDRP